jgi:hypothetical protein
MPVIGHVRVITSLSHDEIVAAARLQAEAGEPCTHGFDVGSTGAVTWERNYLERQRELEEHAG